MMQANRSAVALDPVFSEQWLDRLYFDDEIGVERYGSEKP